MKIKNLSLAIALFVYLFIIETTTCQKVYTPVLSFMEFPKTHNAHITFDGKYYYTCNAGNSIKGKVTQFDKKGNLVKNYGIQLDMRSIMYNKKDKSLYVSSYDQSIYKITDLENGIIQKVNKDFSMNSQATVALGSKGKLLYHFNNGLLNVYSFPDGVMAENYSGLSCGKGFLNGSSAVAVSKKHIFTWNSEKKVIYAYNFKGELIKTFKISAGSYGFSLSYANGLIFVSDDGNYEDGTWYAYDFGLK